MTEDLSHLGDVTWDESPEGQKATSDAIESLRRLEQQNAETDKTKELQTDSETAAKNQAKFRQEIEERQGEEEW